MTAKALNALVDYAPIVPPEAGRLPISGLTADSREVKEGYLFAALPGAKADGIHYISDAASRGASAVLALPSAHDVVRARNLAFVGDDNPRRRFALAASNFFGAQPDVIAAVTGTNGKTSVAYFLRQIWLACGKPAASLGTIGVVLPQRVIELKHTTPEPVELHGLLKLLKDEGINHLAIEASSHGLDQHRLDGLKLSAAGFTNISRDHLDYHHTPEDYLAAKLRLFRDLLAGDGIAVVNADGMGADAVIDTCKRRGITCLSVGQKGKTITLTDLQPLAHGQILKFIYEGRAHEIKLGLAGAFQASNVLVAAGLALACKEDAQAVFAAIEGLQGALGRLQEVARTKTASPVYVDYAHTPDALENVLNALRPHVGGSLFVVFGCGGDRDQGKRALMGEVAARLADKIIVTDDNPRSEDANLIRAAILKGCPGATEIADRTEAIRVAISALAQGDILVIAGKGHESGQIVKDQVLPFSDIKVAQNIALELGGAI